MRPCLLPVLAAAAAAAAKRIHPWACSCDKDCCVTNGTSAEVWQETCDADDEAFPGAGCCAEGYGCKVCICPNDPRLQWLPSPEATAAPAAAARGADAAGCGASPPALSWHLHLLYLPHSPESVAARGRAVAAVTRALNITASCPDLGYGVYYPNASIPCIAPDAAPGDVPAETPFPVAQLYWSVPTAAMMGEVLAVLVQAREPAVEGPLGDPAAVDVLVHPLTGCEVRDHFGRGSWLGSRWPLNTKIMCCDAPGCYHDPSNPSRCVTP